MRFIARIAMRGPLYASAMAAALLLASLAIGFLLIPAGAVIALVTLRHGLREGLRVTAIATALAVAMHFGLAGQGAPMVILAAATWLPAMAMAAVLDQRRQQAWPLLLAALLAAVYAAVMRLLVGDMSAFWGALLQPLFEMVAQETGNHFTAEQVAFIAAQLHGWSLVGLECMLAAMVLLGRYWQAVLFNPGGFGSEFRELRLPRGAHRAVAVVATAVVVDWSTDFALPLAGDLFLILMVSFAFQGLAVIHFRARVATLAGGWLAALYVLLALVPQVTGPILAATGLADGFADFRRQRRPVDDDVPH